MADDSLLLVPGLGARLQSQLIKDGCLHRRHLLVLVMLQQLKDARANASRHTQYDALRDAIDGIRLAIICSIE